MALPSSAPGAAVQGLLSQGHSVVFGAGLVYHNREPVCPGGCPALSPCPCHPGHSWAVLGSLGAAGAVLRCFLSLLPAGGDAMAAAGSSRARAGPPCEKSPLSVRGGSCCLAGIPLPLTGSVSCVPCLPPALSTQDTLRGAGLAMAGAAPCAAGRARLPWGRGCGALPGPRCCSRGREMAPGARSRVPSEPQPALPLRRHCRPGGAPSRLGPVPWGREVSVGTVTVLPPWEG